MLPVKSGKTLPANAGVMPAGLPLLQPLVAMVLWLLLRLQLLPPQLPQQQLLLPQLPQQQQLLPPQPLPAK